MSDEADTGHITFFASQTEAWPSTNSGRIGLTLDIHSVSPPVIPDAPANYQFEIELTVVPRYEVSTKAIHLGDDGVAFFSGGSVALSVAPVIIEGQGAGRADL